METTVNKPILTRQKATYEEYLALPDSARLVEWANEEVITYMPPLEQHQDITRFLGVIIDGFVRVLQLGVLHFSPFEVKLWPGGPSREPDLLFIANNKLARLTEKRIEGAPDLVVEIVSPGSAKIDRVDKFLEYERAGVREYWIVDPRSRQQQVDFFILDASRNFSEAAVEADSGAFHSTVLPGFWLQLGWLWQRPLPNSQLALAEIMMTVESAPASMRNVYRALYEELASAPVQTDVDAGGTMD